MSHDLPSLPEAALKRLEETFKPRCFDPRNETLEDHHVWRGKCELVVALREAGGQDPELPINGISYEEPN